MADNTHKKQKCFRYVAIVLAVVFLFSVVAFIVTKWEKKNGEHSASSDFSDEEFIEYNGKKYAPNENVETFLVLGLDKTSSGTSAESYNNDKQSDFIMLFIFDNKLKEYTAIQINRDTMASVNILGLAGEKLDSKTMQIALAHTYGNGKERSCRNTADAVSQLLFGIDIKNYASVTMDSVPIYNDLLGGVEVTVLDDLTSVDPSLVKGEKVLLHGELALKYVRSRHGLEDSSNAARMLRQQQYLEALREKTVERIANDNEFVAKAVLKMSEYMVSNRTVTQLQQLMSKLSEYKFNGLTDFRGEYTQGEEYMEFYPEQEYLKETVIELFYNPIE